ncbi:unnamed protein product [Aureobasidium mustum]|uniref:Apple domain-containing protein n=1 Tax=Aureobasidium mustum TaxID=2773714 RepID=A0A9N8K9Y5_9PEZI|nr:unnamed protein product [Aureobasidium mustum]
MPSFISAAVAALSLSSLASANVAYRRAEAFTNSSSSSSMISTSSSRSVPLGTASSSIIGTSSGSSSSTAGAGSGSGSNSTATATTGSVSSTTTAAPASSTSATTVDGVNFLIEFDFTYNGITIDLELVLAKRAGQDLEDCLRTCAANKQCVATAYDTNSTTCTFFSEFDSTTGRSAPGIDFAQVTGRANNATTSGAPFPSSTQGNNGTSVTASPNPGNNGTFPNAESIICPTYQNQVLQETDGTQYLIQCGTNINGIVLLTRKARMVRRQATFGNDWIVDCIDSCSAMDACVGTSYNSQQGSCTFYSTIDSLFADANTDSAILVNEAAPAASGSLVPVVSTETVTEGEVTRTITTTPLTTSTVYSTTTKTIQSCAPGVPCSAATVTEVVVAYTTVCPASTVAYPTGAGANGGAAAGAVTTQTVKVCTACQYAPSTVTVYQCPTNGPMPGKPVAVTTTVISVPVLAGPTGPMTTSTVYSTQEQVTTTCGANGCGKATVTAVVSLYTTVCPASSGAPGAPAPSAPSAPGAPGAPAPAPSAGSETVVVPGTTVPASTKPAETIPATVENGSTKPAETVPATVVPGSTKKPSTTIVQYTPTSSMVAYTGAAVKNGMGFAAMAAGVAALVL